MNDHDGRIGFVELVMSSIIAPSTTRIDGFYCWMKMFRLPCRAIGRAARGAVPGPRGSPGAARGGPSRAGSRRRRRPAACRR